MKQTNNAIKFLLAQYRAIFKHAYLKGLASAVVLTTALAAGAAQAGPLGVSSGSAFNELSGSGEYTNIDNATELALDKSGSHNWNATLILDGNQSSGSLIITNKLSDAASGSASFIGNGTLTIKGQSNKSGTFTLTNATDSKNTIELAIKDVKVESYGVLNVTAATAKATVGGQYDGTNYTNISLAEGGVINLSGSGTANYASLVGNLNATGGAINNTSTGNVISIFGQDQNLDLNVKASSSAADAQSLIFKGTDLTDTKDTDESVLQITAGNIVIEQAGNAGSGSGLLEIQKGTVEIIDDTVLVAASGGAGAAKTVPGIKVSGSGTNANLEIDQDILTNFLTSKATLTDTTTYSNGVTAGGVQVSASGSLLINPPEANGTVDLYYLTQGGSVKILSGSDVVAGEINVDGGTIEADKLAISGKTGTANLNLGKANLKANTLTLGNDNLAAGDSKSITFSGATVSDKFETQISGGTFELASGVTLERDYFQKDSQSLNASNLDGTPILVGSSGTITGADIRLSGSAGILTVTSGKWVADKDLDITVNADTELKVTSTAATNSSGYLNNADTAYLKLNGKLTLASGDVTVTGASGADAILDLSNADVVFNSGTITVSGNALNVSTGFTQDQSEFFAGAFEDKVGLGKLIITNSDLNDYLKSTVKLDIGTDGVVEIADAEKRTLDIDKLGTTGSGKIAFTGAGYLVYDNALNIQSSGDNTAVLNIGSGTIVAKQIDISAALKNIDKTVNDTTVVGNLIVSNGFSTNSESLTLGNGSAKASITLAANNSTDAGSISVGNSGTLTLSGGSAISSLNVTSGVWENDKLNIAVATGAAGTGVVVGSDEKNDPSATFTANNFASTLASANVLKVNQTGKAQFTSMQLANGDTVDVHGQLTLLGRNVDTSAESKDPLSTAKTVNGIALSGSTFNISGTTAVLEFGAKASSALVNMSGNATASEGESKLLVVENGISGANFKLTDFGTLKFNFDKNVTLSAKDLTALETQAGIDGVGSGGFLNIGDADIGVTVTEKDGNYYAVWEDNVENFAGVTAGGVTSNKLETALITGLKTTDKVQGKYGALKSENQYAIQTEGTLSLGNAAPFGGYFAHYTDGTGTKQASDLDLGGDLNLQNGGIVGAISANGNDVVLSSSVDEPALTEIKGSVSGAAKFDVQTATVVHGDIDAEDLIVSSSLDNSQELNNDTTSTSTIIAQGADFKTNDWTIGDNSAGTVTDSFIMGNATAKNVTIHNTALNVLNGTLSVDSITADSDSEIVVGYVPSETALDAPETDFVDESKSYTGYLQVGNLSLNGGLLAVDPIYGQDTAFASVSSLYGYNNLSTNDKQTWAGTLDGSAFVGQNSVLGIGTDSLAALQKIAAPYMYGNTLKADDTGAIIYLGKKIRVDESEGITLTALSYDEFISDFNARNNSNSSLTDFVVDADPIIENAIFLGQNTALILSEDAVNSSKVTSAETQVEGIIDFTSDKASVIADGGRIDINGDVRANATYQIFNDGDNSISIIQMDGKTYDGKDPDYAIKISTENGFLVGVVDEKGQAALGVADDARAKLSGASDPVYTSLVAYANGYNGDNATDEAAKLYDGYVKGTETKNTNYNNDVLQSSITTGNGADAEHVARLGVYAGAAQAAITAGASTYEAVSGRMGVGAQTGSVTFADNGQGAGLWVTPVYKNHDSDDFEAQGLSYGADMDMYGVALGGDFTMANGLRVGAAFNVGSGDADGQGAGAGVSNDFDYYGFSVYGGYTLDKLSIVGDISYTVVDNDAEANTGIGKATASLDTTNMSVGVTGQYTFNLNAVDVTPHAGLRYTYIDMDDYTVQVYGTEQARYTADSMSIFSIPVGVTFSKDIVSGDWTIKPTFDLTLTANVGDDSMDGSVTWAGVDNLQTNLESEVIDNFTYGATLGVAAKSGNFSLGFGVNYTGASSADEYGVSANARFVF